MTDRCPKMNRERMIDDSEADSDDLDAQIDTDRCRFSDNRDKHGFDKDQAQQRPITCCKKRTADDEKHVCTNGKLCEVLLTICSYLYYCLKTTRHKKILNTIFTEMRMTKG